MTLTPEQLLERQTGLGGSELGAVLGVDGWKTALDVWCSKARGVHGEIPPLAKPLPEIDTPSAFAPIVEAEPAVAGQILEQGIVDLYCHRTGARVRKSGTRRHPKHRWAIATPDRLVDHEEDVDDDHVFARGLECKLVGHFMSDEWGHDEPPERVWVQCQWGMAITGLVRWDIAALIGGSSFRTYRVARDDAFIDDALAIAGDWWERHVIADWPPDPVDAADLARFTRRRHPLDNGESLEVGEGHDAVPLIQHLVELKEEIAHLEAVKAETTAKLEALCGSYRSIVLPGAGRFNFASYQGQVSWKKVAEHLHGGPIEDAVADLFRGEPFRKSQYYPFKKKAGKAA